MDTLTIDQKQRILDQRTQFQNKVTQLSNYFSGQSDGPEKQHKPSSQNMLFLNYKSAFSPTTTIINPETLPSTTEACFSLHSNSLTRAQFLQTGFLQSSKQDPSQFFQFQLQQNQNLQIDVPQKEVKQFPAKNKKQLEFLLKYPPAKTEQDAQWNVLAKSARFATEDDLQLKSNQMVNRYKICGSKVIEQGANKKQLFYSFGSCQAEGELFGISYMDIKPHEAKFYSKTNINNQSVQDKVTMVENVQQNSVKQQIRQRLKTYPKINVMSETQLFDKLAIAQSLQFTDNVPQKIHKYIRDILTKNKQKNIVSIPKVPGPKVIHQPRERIYSETYDKKMIIGKDFIPKLQGITALQGFQSGASQQAIQESLSHCPTLPHFIVCLLANQQVNVKLREEDVFYSTCGHDIFMNRQSMVLRDIILAIKNNYPKVRDLLMPAELPAMECLLTTLFMLVSPNDSFVDEIKVESTQCIYKTSGSIFDNSGGTIESGYGPCLVSPQPCPALFLPNNTGAIMTEQERFQKEGDKVEQMRKQFISMQQPLQGPPKQQQSEQQIQQNMMRQQLLSSTVKNFDDFQKSGLFKSMSPETAIKMFNDCSRGSCKIVERLVSFLQEPDQPFYLYLSMDQFTIVTMNSKDQYVVDCISISPEEYSELDTKQLFLSEEELDKLKLKAESQVGTKKTSKDNENSDEDTELVADDLADVQPCQTSILDMCSPLLGEFQLHCYQNLPSLNSYYGVNLDNLNRISYLCARQLEHDVKERNEMMDLFDQNYFNQISNAASNSDRLQAIQKSKQKIALSLNAYEQQSFQYRPIDRLHYRAQERLRYFLIPHMPFSFVIRGRKHFVAPVHRYEAKSQLYKQLDYRKCIPQYMTKINAVQDACARLPARFGTREDIVDKCLDSHFFNPSDGRLTNKISCAMDRLRLNIIDKEKKLRAATFSSSERIWFVMPGRLVMTLEGGRLLEEWPNEVQDWYIRGIRAGGMIAQNYQNYERKPQNYTRSSANSNMMTIQSLESMIAAGQQLTTQQQVALSQMKQFQQLQQKQMLQMQHQQQMRDLLRK